MMIEFINVTTTEIENTPAEIGVETDIERKILIVITAAANDTKVKDHTDRNLDQDLDLTVDTVQAIVAVLNVKQNRDLDPDREAVIAIIIAMIHIDRPNVDHLTGREEVAVDLIRKKNLDPMIGNPALR